LEVLNTTSSAPKPVAARMRSASAASHAMIIYTTIDIDTRAGNPVLVADI